MQHSSQVDSNNNATVVFGEGKSSSCQVEGLPAGLASSWREPSEKFSFRDPLPNANSGDPWVGKQLDRYVVEKKLGSGGMGTVYLARHRWLDQPVAIKIMHSALSQDAVSVERFRREARLVAKLDHSNIVKAIDGGLVDDTCYLVTEFLDGQNLASLVQRHGPLSIGHACEIVRNVSQGLQHAHENGLIHRDIKPENIMVARDGSVKILDLGLARHAVVETSMQMTTAGQFMGSADYVSPEQAISDDDLDHRADIYSLGCTLYFLLTGVPPFAGDGYQSVVSKILAHTDEVAKPIEQLRKGVPRELIHFVERMLEKNPEDRPYSALEVDSGIQKFCSPIAVDKWFDVRTEAALMHRHRVARKKGFLLFAVADLCLVGLGIRKRVEVNPNSRSNINRIYRTRMNWSCVFAWMVILVALFLLYEFISRSGIVEVPSIVQ